MYYNFVNELSQGISVEEEYIKKIEQEYGIHFPPLLLRYYLDHNGQKIRPVELKIGTETFEVRKMEAFQDPGLSLENLLHMQQLQQYPVKQMIPIADDRGNGMYYLHTETGVIYYSQLSGEDDFFPVCQGIDSFFQILDDACLEGKTGPYEISEFLGHKRGSTARRFLPLGSVVMLRGARRKIMIVARGISVEHGESTFFFDYGGVIYPVGLTEDQMVYFNENGITRIYFQGYADSEDDAAQTAMRNYLETHPNINIGNPDYWEDE